MFAQGNIFTGDVEAESHGGGGGAIAFHANGNITTGKLLSRSTLNGASITLTAGGNLTTAQLWTSSGNGDSGTIRLTANGTINTSHLYSRSGEGNGGEIAISAGSSITTGSIQSSTEHGNGGNVFLTSNSGSITTGPISTGSYLIGNGGTIEITANGNINLNEVFSGVFMGNAGDIRLTTQANINITSGAFQNYFLGQCGSTGLVTINCGSNNFVTLTPTGTTTYPGINWLFSSITGEITITSDGNFTINPVDSLASSLHLGGSGNDNSINDPTALSGTRQGDGGDIALNAGGDITTGAIGSGSLDEGNGGNIDFTSQSSITTGDLNSSTRTNGNGGNAILTAKDSLNTGYIDARSQDRSGRDGNIQLLAREIHTGQLFSNNIFVANQQSTVDFKSLSDTALEIEQLRTLEFKDYFQENFPNQLMTTTNIQKMLRTVASQTNLKPAVIYTVIQPQLNQLQLVLVNPDGKPIRKNISITDNKTLLKKAKDFSSDVRDKLNKNGYLAEAQQLYDLLIRPLEADLQAQGIDTLLFSLDPGLRSIPLAALHDRQQFLVEKYRFSLVPSLTLADIHYNGIAKAQLLAMGISKFPPPEPLLPAVPTEISTIAQKLWSGKSFLNQDVTMNNLKVQRQQPFQIIHLATHAKFESLAGHHNSYIQLWDKKLQLDELTDLKWSDTPTVELLVLSACQTALGNKDAEMGFAGLAVKAGVKSAIASLWKTDDVGTLGLMTNFYQQLRHSPIPLKAEALRQAQIAMLRGQVRIENGQLRKVGIEEGVPLPPELVKMQPNTSFSHPSYWAAFTVIGSPW
jgi:CHAT domain-containing protein